MSQSFLCSAPRRRTACKFRGERSVANEDKTDGTYAAALAVEGGRCVLHGVRDDLLDLLVGNRRLGRERVDGAAVLDELEECSRARHGGAV